MYHDVWLLNQQDRRVSTRRVCGWLYVTSRYVAHSVDRFDRAMYDLSITLLCFKGVLNPFATRFVGNWRSGSYRATLLKARLLP